MVGLGVAFMFIATWLLLEFEKTLWSSFVVVLLEPAGHLFWGEQPEQSLKEILSFLSEQKS